MEKLIPSVPAAVRALGGASKIDISMGADGGIYCLCNTEIVTEIEAVKILFDAGQVSLVGGVQEIFKNKPEQLKALIGEDDRKVSVTMDVQDFAMFQEYLDKNGTNYRISGGV